MSSLKRKDQVFIFNDYISDEEVPGFFSAADVCVLPYKSATQSGITSIAYHFETPIIATDVGGLKESIRHNETGLIVHCCEPEAVAVSVREFFEGRLAEKLISGIQKIKENLSWKNFAQDILDFTNQL